MRIRKLSINELLLDPILSSPNKLKKKKKKKLMTVRIVTNEVLGVRAQEAQTRRLSGRPVVRG